jgi:RNA polymerase sigma-70 factor (ECF subfamily)
MSLPEAPKDFSTTHWSLIAGLQDGDAAAAHASLLTLCLRYWYPVYAYLRRSGHASGHAYDLTRAFFEHLLREGAARTSAVHYGRFRLFLLAELHRFLSGNPVAVAMPGTLDAPPLQELEARHQAETAPEGSPEQGLRRGFAVEILASARQHLRREAREAGRLEMFDALERFLSAESQPGDYDAIARRLQVRPLFVAVAVKRLRQRFRELVDRELGEILSSNEEMDAERSALLQALGGETA